MALVRQNRNYFIGSNLPRGTAYKRFRALNKPDENAFINVFNSILMPNEVDDTATSTFSGHSRVALDNDVIIRKNSYNDGHTRFIKPNQVPVGAMSIENKNLTYKLINDEADPGANKFYGTNADSEKGFFPMASASKQYIDIQKTGCTTRYHTDGNYAVEKILFLSKNELKDNTRYIWTVYYCCSTYDVQTEVSLDLLTEINGSVESRRSMWTSAQDAYPPLGSSVDPYTTLCKATVVIDLLGGEFYINCYNEYHKHGDGEYLPGRSCCYAGGPIPNFGTTDLLLMLSYKIPASGNTFSYGRSDVTIYSTQQISTTV